MYEPIRLSNVCKDVLVFLKISMVDSLSHNIRMEFISVFVTVRVTCRVVMAISVCPADVFSWFLGFSLQWPNSPHLQHLLYGYLQSDLSNFFRLPSVMKAT
jgi:hypothetical protein